MPVLTQWLHMFAACRVSDRLVMEQLMVEVLEELAGRELLPDEAAAVMQLAGEARVQQCRTACNSESASWPDARRCVLPYIWSSSRHTPTSRYRSPGCDGIMLLSMLAAAHAPGGFSGHARAAAAAILLLLPLCWCR